MSTMATCTAMLPLKGNLGRDFEAGSQQDFELHKASVLRFFCVWEHSTRQFGNKAGLLLHYFLQDDTLELRQLQQNEVHTHAFAANVAVNDDYRPYPQVFKRMKLIQCAPSPTAQPLITMRSWATLICKPTTSAELRLRPAL